jgi:transcriptional regulator with XRE-family HTH domain
MVKKENKKTGNIVIEERAVNYVNEIVKRIIAKRDEKKYNLENIADELGISSTAYWDVEKQVTSLTLQRFLQIQMILGVSLNELLDIKTDAIYNQHFTDKSTGYFSIQNLHQDNKELTESLIKNLKDEIVFLRKLLEDKN